MPLRRASRPGASDSFASFGESPLSDEKVASSVRSGPGWPAVPPAWAVDGVSENVGTSIDACAGTAIRADASTPDTGPIKKRAAAALSARACSGRSGRDTWTDTSLVELTWSGTLHHPAVRGGRARARHRSDARDKMLGPVADPLSSLAPEQHALLSLVLSQGRSYDEIAEILGMDPAGIRERAHTAARSIMGAANQLPPDAYARIVDYLLGDQGVSERARTRAELESSAAASEWASSLAAVLAPLADGPLPTVPAAAAAAEVSPEPPRKRARRRPPLAPTLSLVAAFAAVAALVAILSSGRGHTRAAQPHRATASGGHVARTVRRLILAPAGANHRAFGAAVVVRQSGGLLLLVQAKGLAPNHGDSYAVWLVNTPADARLLGFVSPAVGGAGTFSSGVPLPDDAVRFHNLEVTRETSSSPSIPGPAVLSCTLSLS
jgi:anti-sigma-K factor RskA